MLPDDVELERLRAKRNPEHLKNHNMISETQAHKEKLQAKVRDYYNVK